MEFLIYHKTAKISIKNDGISNTRVYNKYDMKKDKKKEPTSTISKADQDMIDELDYEYKKAHKPYDKWERHWDEA